MKWILSGVVIALCAVSGLLGLTAGVNLNPDSTVKFVPVWGSLGDWVSGLGALLAVLVTLWLADKQRREDVAELLVVPNISVIQGEETWLLTVNVISKGKRPSLATSISISSKHSKKVLWPQNLHRFSGSLPANLSYGEKVDLIFTVRNIQQLAEFVLDHCDGKKEGLKLNILTTLETFSAPLDGIITHLLTDVIESLKAGRPSH